MDGKVAEHYLGGSVGHLEHIDSLGEVLESHYDWLWAVQRALVCGEPGAHAHCRLSDWLAASHGLPQEAQGLISLVVHRHRAVHGTVEALLAHPHDRGRMAAARYDAFLHARKAFKEAAVQLERALWNSTCLLDALTGLRNRHGMFMELREEQQRARRDGRPCTLAMMDIDHFKAINDGHGHDGGDVVLRTLTRLATLCLRPYDRIYRYGGEEFLLCLPDTGTAQAAAIIERLREEIAMTTVCAGHQPLHVTASFGIAPLDLQRPVEASLAQADAALYRAKAQGRNRVVAVS